MQTYFAIISAEAVQVVEHATVVVAVERENPGTAVPAAAYSVANRPDWVHSHCTSVEGARLVHSAAALLVADGVPLLLR